MRRARLARLGPLVVAGLLLAGPGAAAPAGAATRRPPDLVGTWEGAYTYPSPDGTVHPGHEKLVIDRQEGVHLWGHDEFVDRDGATVRIPVLGTVVDGDIGLAEKSGFFVGHLSGRHRMVLRFVLTGETPTSFRLDLKRAHR